MMELNADHRRLFKFFPGSVIIRFCRLAGLELDSLEALSQQRSPLPSRGRSRGSLATGSSKSLRTNSTRSLASISENTTSFKSGNDVDYEEQLTGQGQSPGKMDDDVIG